MNEEIKKQAVELTDEAQEVTGGDNTHIVRRREVTANNRELEQPPNIKLIKRRMQL